MRHLAFLMNEQLYIQLGNWDSSEGIVTRLLDGQLRNCHSIPSRCKGFLPSSNIYTGFGTHPASYSMGSTGSIPRGKTARA
jgi:hypothetical protein